jgi:hypothetical protein
VLIPDLIFPVNKIDREQSEFFFPHSLIIFDPSNYKNKQNKQKKTLNNNNLCNNNFKYCFNQLYYDCKHLIVLIHGWLELI